MKFLNNIKISGRLILGLGIVLIFMLAIIVVGLISLQRAHAQLDYIVLVNNAQTREANQMIDNARQTAIAVRDYLLANYAEKPGSEMQGYLETLNAKRQIYAEALALLTKLSAENKDAELTALLSSLETEAATVRTNQDHAIELVKAGDLEGGTNYMFTVAYPSVRTWIAKVDALILYQDQQTLQQYEDAKRSYDLTRTFMLVLGVTALILSVIISILLTLSITAPLSLVTKMIDARDLSMNVSAHENRRDEIGIMIRSFSGMIEMIRSQMKIIRESVNQLGSTVSEILAATTQIASGTAETASAINQTTTTVEEVRQAAQLSSQKAQYVSDNAQRVAQVSQSGQKAVEETSAGMERIREQMETIAQTVVRLSEQGQSIGGIIASVTDIADQSKLLAVNAAIEAAKAGEQGKGFAVVAQEIKILAEQSKQATAQVRGILSDVQKATSSAVMATEQGSKAVEAGVKQAAQVGESIRALTEASEEAVQAATQIVASGQQQVVGMDQIGLAMENINQSGAQNASSMKQMEVAAQNLHELGEKLKELVEQFKV